MSENPTLHPNELAPTPEDDARDLIGDPLPAEDPALVALRGDLERERQERQQSEARYQQMVAQLVQNTAQPAKAPAEPEPLPDPLNNPTEYSNALTRRLEGMIESRVAQSAQSVMTQTEQQALLNSLWQRMQSEHSDIAGRELLIQAAAGAEANEMRARGLDPASALRGDPGGFVNRVAERVRKELGQTTSTPPRTRGVSAGSVPAAPTPAAPPKGKSFLEQLKDQQAAMGLH